jgi:hypothetical protein
MESIHTQPAVIMIGGSKNPSDGAPNVPVQLAYATPSAGESGAASREWFVSLQTGLALLLVAAAVQVASGFLRYRQWIGDVAELVGWCVSMATFLLGLWRLAADDDASTWTRSRGALRWTIRVTALLYALCMPLMYLLSGTGLLSDGFIAILLARSLVVGVLASATFAYLMRTARRLGWSRLARSATIAVWIWAMVAVLSNPFAYVLSSSSGIHLALPSNAQPVLGYPSELGEQLLLIGERLALRVFGVRWAGPTPWGSLALTVSSLVLLEIFRQAVTRAKRALNERASPSFDP